VFVEEVIQGKIPPPSGVDLVVVDPPWSHEKRGRSTQLPRLSRMPYHLKSVNSRSIISAAERLASHLNTPLLYRYKEPLGCKHIVRAEAEVKILRCEGTVYYGGVRGVENVGFKPCLGVG